MQKKIKHENDIHWPQSLVSQGKNGDIPWISRISINAAEKENKIWTINLCPSLYPWKNIDAQAKVIHVTMKV